MNRRGIELAADEINAKGGVDGRLLRVEYKNDEADGARAVAIAKGFVDDPRVLAVIGHVTSGAMVAAAKVYDGNLAAVSTTATSPDLTGISRWVFRVISSDSANGMDLGQFAARMGHKRAAILYENDSYGRGLADSFRRNFSGAIVTIDPISAADTDFEPFITYYQRHAVDVVFVAGTEGTGMRILREARRQHLAADFIGGDGWTGIVADSAASEGAYVGAPFAASDQRPEVQRFVSAFKEKYGMTPDGNAALAYDATKLIAQALHARGANRFAIRDYLASLDESTAFHGVTGLIRFHDTGDPVGKGIVMTRVHHGDLIVVSGQ